MSLILIIEDDPTSLMMMKMILRKEGFEVRSASNGESGLALIHEKHPNLILCDIMMPDMDGHMVLETLKRDPQLTEVPFIFVTAKGDRADVRFGMSEGADDYLSKPFSADELLAAVNSRILRHDQIFKQSNASIYCNERNTLQKKISKRERDVLQMVGKGITSREIGKRLGISHKTIEIHRSSLMKKLDASNAAALARWAFIAEQMEVGYNELD